MMIIRGQRMRWEMSRSAHFMRQNTGVCRNWPADAIRAIPPRQRNFADFHARLRDAFFEMPARIESTIRPLGFTATIFPLRTGRQPEKKVFKVIFRASAR